MIFKTPPVVCPDAVKHMALHRRTIGHRWMIEIAAGVAPHPDPLHHGAGPQVADRRECHDLRKSFVREAELQRAAGGFRGIALSPMIAGETPAYLDARCEMCGQRGNGETRKADERRTPRHLDRPEPEA